MTITFFLPIWVVLPLLVSVALLCAALWADFFRDSWGWTDWTYGAVIGSIICWVLILYGRYERFLVLPVAITIFAVVSICVKRRDATRDGVKAMAILAVSCWSLVVYGRLTA